MTKLLYVYECSSECVDEIDDVIRDSMEHYHISYVNSCIDLGFCRGLVATLDNEVVGVGVYYVVNSSPNKVGVIYYVAVKAKYRGLGLGKVLVSSIEELMLSEHVKISLATTRADNNVIKSVLSKLGYTEIFINSLNSLSNIIKKLTCGYDDDLLFIKFLDEVLREATPSILMFLETRSNSDLINNLWRFMCYEVWLKNKGGR